jgi:hypothetical protein
LAKVLAGTPSRPRDLRILAPDAAKILQGNVYGWFERIERGLYGLTSSGRIGLVKWASHLAPVDENDFGGTCRLAVAPSVKLRSTGEQETDEFCI